VSDLPTEDVKVDELVPHMDYPPKAIRKLTLSEAKSSVPWPPNSSFINEQSVTILDLLYNLIAWVLTEDQSDRPISSLKVEMSEATNMRVVSFSHDIIYAATRGKVKTQKHVGLVILVQICPPSDI
jgi:hypothetical protein